MILSLLSGITHSAPTTSNTDTANIAIAERQQSFNGPPGYFNFVGVNGNNQWAMIPMDAKIHEMRMFLPHPLILTFTTDAQL